MLFGVHIPNLNDIVVKASNANTHSTHIITWCIYVEEITSQTEFMSECCMMQYH